MVELKETQETGENQITLHTNPLINTVACYIGNLVHKATGVALVDIPICARELDKFIAARKFISGGEIKINPAILKLRGDYILYWRQVYPTLRAEYPDKVFSNYFYRVYQHMIIGGHSDPQEIVVRVSGVFSGSFTLQDLRDFLTETKML